MNYQDDLTKFEVLRALKTKRGEEVAYRVVDIFCLLGSPHILQSDNGREFAKKIIFINVSFDQSILALCKCANVQLCKCTNVQMCKCANVQMCKYANMQMYTCANVQMCKCANV